MLVRQAAPRAAGPLLPQASCWKHIQWRSALQTCSTMLDLRTIHPAAAPEARGLARLPAEQPTQVGALLVALTGGDGVALRALGLEDLGACVTGKQKGGAERIRRSREE